MNHKSEESAGGQTKTKWEERLEGVVQQLMLHRFLSICGLLVAYLHLLLFLSLALAFHDRAIGGGSIERLVRRIPDSSTNADVATSATATGTVAESGSWLDPTRPVHMVAFTEGSANLRCTSSIDTSKLDSRFYEGGTAWQSRFDAVRNQIPAENHPCWKELNQIAWNLVALDAIEKELIALRAESPFDRFQAIVVAHATDTPPKGAFSSNYELSNARGEQVKILIERTLSIIRRRDPVAPPLNVEWSLAPSGASAAYLAVIDEWRSARLAGAHLKKELSAEVQFVPVPRHLTALQRESLEPRKSNAESELQLLDYVYFMTTRAGANDLAPATGFVQFVAAVGHVFQLFFFVVAFNVILAFRRES